MQGLENTEIKYEVDKKGNLVSTVTYPGKPIEIDMAGRKVIVGNQPKYNLVNVIDKTQVREVYMFVAQQEKLLKADSKAMNERLKELKWVDSEGIKPMLAEANLIEAMKKNRKSKKYDEINSFLQMVTQKIDLLSKIEVIEPNLDKYREQLEFIEKNFKEQINL